MGKYLQYAIQRGKEPSTWRGAVWIATAAGVSISPELTAQIITAGTALAGLLGMVIPDKK